MTFSLEARNPFLDVGVVEAALGLGIDQHLHDGFTKWTLREAMRSSLPPEIVERAGKQGFTTDESEWIRSRLGHEMEAAFRSEPMAARGLFDTTRLLELLEEHRAGANHSSELWAAFVTERWFRMFIDPRRIAPPPPPSTAVGSPVSALDRVA
jgi:asparagine synthase (glutamine-hydrolysing)